MLLGDRIGAALGTVGLTKERISDWLGEPCGCSERAEKLNSLDRWARRILAGKVKSAKEYLERIING